jgi:hypothetical protein
LLVVLRDDCDAMYALTRCRFDGLQQRVLPLGQCASRYHVRVLL